MAQGWHAGRQMRLSARPAAGRSIAWTPTIRSRVVNVRVAPLGRAEMEAFLGDAAFAAAIRKSHPIQVVASADLRITIQTVQ